MRITEIINEAVLDPSGWGQTPYGTDIDYFGLRVQMKPSTFLELALPLGQAETNPEVEKHMKLGGKIAQPILDIKIPPEWEDGQFEKPAAVVSHEGRNRMTQWIKLHGDEPIQINILPRGGMRRRHITDAMIYELSKGMIGQRGNFVKGPLFSTDSALEEDTKIDREAKAKAFIEKVYNKFPKSPMNPRQRIMTWGEGDDMEFAIFELAPSVFRENAVEINWIQSYPHGAGVGTRAIQALQNFAIQDGISLTLYPWDKGRMSQTKLTKFYKNRGFKPIDKTKNLIWNPEIDEAEQRTPASIEIRKNLRGAGYKLLGSGADATVWAKKEGPVIKIIMPDDGQGAGVAGDTFMKFYEFCKEHPNYENLPKFSDNEVEVFQADGKDYIMVTMERLSPIPSGSFQEAMVWILSDLATKKLSWEQANEIISDEDTWFGYESPKTNPETILRQFDSLDDKDLLEYEVLYKLMVLLYHRGRINKIGWDLHTENAMMRSDTIVITDPWFNMETKT